MRSRSFGVAALVALPLAWGAPARSEPAQGPRPSPARSAQIRVRSSHLPLGPKERELLLSGETVSLPMVIERGEGRYVGGVAYQLVRARPDELLAALGSPEELAKMLPRTKSARMVAVGARGGEIELTQGNALVEATYTVRLRRAGPRELRFALEPGRPHGIRDVYGFVRAVPFGPGRTLVTVAVALDVGPGLARALFEDRIQQLILSTPRHIRDYMEPRALASSR